MFVFISLSFITIQKSVSFWRGIDDRPSTSTFSRLCVMILSVLLSQLLGYVSMRSVHIIFIYLQITWRLPMERTTFNPFSLEYFFHLLLIASYFPVTCIASLNNGILFLIGDWCFNSHKDADTGWGFTIYQFELREQHDFTDTEIIIISFINV